MMGRLKDKVAYFKKQHYEDLRKHHIEEKTLFIDPTFPAVDAIIGTSSIPSNIQWKRPQDMTSDPRLFVDIETSRSVSPGELSSNWIVSACAVLAGIRELCNRVIPDYWEQEWPKNYCGIFHFQFWRFGMWTHVVVDDLLPTVDGVLLTTQAESENEFWTPLLEKAYAKLHGSYDALSEGHLCDALVDFTGGVSEVIDLHAEELSTIEEKRSALLEMLLKEIADHSIMCFTVVASTPSEVGTRTPLGLCKGHAYHVSAVKRVHLGETGLRALFKGREKVPMIRLRDPIEVGLNPVSGDRDDAPESEAQFAYSTSSLSHLLSTNSEWAKVRECDRQRLGLHVNEKSEFWMPLEDVVSQFTELTICRLLNRNLFQLPGKTWVEATFVDHWRTGLTGTSADRSGGAEETVLRNPQYMCDIEKAEEEILVQLMQFHDEDTETRGCHNLLIGFCIIKVEENRKTRLHKLWDHCVTAVKIDHKRKREVNYRGILTAGRYIIVPTTYKVGDTAGFVLRVFSQSDLSLRELCQDVPKGISPCSCISGDYEWVTVITIHKAEGLVKPGRWSGSLNPYCVLMCEGNKIKTPVAKDDLEPTWNASYMFYRKKVDKPILIQLYSHNTVLPDSLIGETELPAVVTHKPTFITSVLTSRIKSSGDDATSVLSPGTLYLTTLTEDNVMAV